ncbi:MAG: DNA polymerase beta superfamily protein [Candidatus Thorarchaeota archaeon]|jgi:predicted nucleotidyltransferase
MPKFKWPKFGVEFDVKKHTILLGLAGSRSYGTDHPLSDTDYKGIIVPPREYYLSPFRGFEQTQWKGDGLTGRLSELEGKPEADVEGTLFGIQKFVKLASACNPNVVETLFVDERHLVVLTDEGRELRKHRQLFLSERATKTFTGYALSQLKRIKTHKSWIDSPIEDRPDRADYELPKAKLLPGQQLGAARSYVSKNTHALAPWLLEADNQHKAEFWNGMEKILVTILNESGIEYSEEHDSWLEIEESAKDRVAESLGFDSNFVDYLQREKRYGQDKQRYEQYQSWKKNRNPARAELEARYGYDCKHAMHLVRLLRMGEEILTTGDFNVYRPDREELLAIRNGEWSYEKLIEWSDEKVDELYSIVRAGKAVVPKKPDQHAIEELVIKLQDSLWKRVTS